MRVRVLGVVTMVLAAVACWGEGGGGNFGTGINQPPPPPAPPDSSTLVTIIDNAFVPNTAAVTVGKAVRWTNGGALTHNVTAGDASFSSGAIVSGGQFQRTFTVAGNVAYSCTLHGETGLIAVSP